MFMHSALLERTLWITTASIRKSTVSVSFSISFFLSIYVNFPFFVALILHFCLQPEEHCTLCLPPTLCCLWMHSERERERERESCVCYLGGVAVVALSSLITGHWECGSGHTQQPFRSQFGHETNTFCSYTNVCRLFKSPSYSYLSISPLETFVKVLALDAVLSWCDWWHVEWSQLVPLTHICFFPPPLLSRYHGLLDTNSAGITIVSAFYHIYGQFDWSQLSYQALQQSPIREDPLSPRRW